MAPAHLAPSRILHARTDTSPHSYLPTELKYPQSPWLSLSPNSDSFNSVYYISELSQKVSSDSKLKYLRARWQSRRSSAVSRRESDASATLVSEKRSFEFAGDEERFSRVRRRRGAGGAGGATPARRRLGAARRSTDADWRRRGIDTSPPAAARVPFPHAPHPPRHYLPAPCARIARELCLPRRNFIFRTMVKRLIDTLHY